MPPTDWNPAETRLWHAFRQGAELDLGALDEAERKVRADVVAELLLHGPEALPGRVTALKLAGAEIQGRLDLEGAVIEPALALVGCTFEHGVNLTTASAGSICLNDSHLPELSAELLRARTFMMRDAKLDGNLWIQGARVEADIDLDRTRVAGFLNANLAVTGGWFNGRGSPRHDHVARGLTVGGELDLVGAQLAGLDLHGARIGDGVWARGAVIGYACLATAEIGGPLSLRAARITGELDLDAVVIRPPSGAVMIDLSDAEVVSAVVTPSPAGSGRLSLRNARITAYADEPAAGHESDLDGFAYQRLDPLSPEHADERLAWLERGSAPGTPQPYEQLAAAYRAAGLHREAGRVLREKLRRAARARGGLARAWGALQDLVLGYGYQPWRAVVAFAAVLVAGTLYFATVSCPTLCPIKADEHPAWDPFLYTLDLLIPLANLGHDGVWNPLGLAKAVSLVVVVAGWALVTTIAAAAARALTRP
ncbi:hypothetical protein ACIBEJ_29120 [Nonomuraea sp. NPDC050790]|uniref:hypothetical protein n=1 Tax=Nonomuraea sp. NPDC050790 TaxID=3364371 RepID=UPI0037A8C605